VVLRNHQVVIEGEAVTRELRDVGALLAVVALPVAAHARMEGRGVTLVLVGLGLGAVEARAAGPGGRDLDPRRARHPLVALLGAKLASLDTSRAKGGQEGEDVGLEHGDLQGDALLLGSRLLCELGLAGEDVVRDVGQVELGVGVVADGRESGLAGGLLALGLLGALAALATRGGRLGGLGRGLSARQG
jgi:hypothetical protein